MNARKITPYQGIVELERENAALREHHQQDEALIVQRTDEIRHLETENAALRADRERLLDILQRWQRMADEWYSEADQYGFGEPNITAGMINDARAAIDAARKEQP